MESKIHFRNPLRSIIAAVTCLLFLVVAEIIVKQDHQLIDAFHKMELNNRANLLRNSIEREINTTLQLSSGLIVYVSTHPEVDSLEFKSLAAALIKKAPYIRNIGLAKDNVISHIYPFEGNEKAIGLDFMKTPAQRDAVLRAISEENTVIAGPVNLVQGGVGLIGRIPIYSAEESQKYWGIASVVVAFDQFQNHIVSLSDSLGISVALRGKDGFGDSGEVFTGESTLFEEKSSSVLIPIKLPVGEWQLAAKANFKSPIHSNAIQIRLFGYILSLLISLLLYLLLRAYEEHHHLSLHDTLTGLANRRLFDEQIKHSLALAQRRKSLMGILYIDLNKFKPINDTYGHKTGDIVLKTSAERMIKTLRKADIIARVGGDEFIVILQDLQTVATHTTLVNKLDFALSEPITLPSGVKVDISASIGVAIYPANGETIPHLMKHADQEMYRKKNR